MSVQVSYLNKLPQFVGKPSEASRPALQIKAKHLANNQAMDWMAAQTALILGFENGRPNENDMATQALAFAQSESKENVNFDFVTRLGDKLNALRPDAPRQSEADEVFQSIWSPGAVLFDRLGGEVFEIDQETTGNKTLEGSQTDNRSAKATIKKSKDDERQVELAEALRWTVSVSSVG